MLIQRLERLFYRLFISQNLPSCLEMLFQRLSTLLDAHSPSRDANNKNEVASRVTTLVTRVNERPPRDAKTFTSVGV